MSSKPIISTEVENISNYLREIGYKYSNRKDIDLFDPDVFERGDIEIEYDALFGDGFRIFKGAEKVFDIDEETRNVMKSANTPSGTMRTRGIKHRVRLSEVKDALRNLNIDNLLDE